MGDTWLSNAMSKTYLGIVLDNKLNMSQQCDVHLALVRPHLEYCVQFWTPHFKKNANKLKQIQRRATRMIRVLETKPYEESLKELGMFSLEKRRLRRDTITHSKYLKDCHIEAGQDLF